jgi:ABC-type nitrate/sulfonate/bicarbonate transport system permease component
VTRSVRSGAYGVLGVALVLLLWQLLASTGTLGGTLTAPTVVARVFADPAERTTLSQAAFATGMEAVEGFLWSLLYAVVIGLLVTVLRPLRRGVDQLATIESAIPFVSLAPIILAVFSREHVPAAMAAATAFFPLYIAVVAGMDAVSSTVADLCTVLGASRYDTLFRARIPAGLPVIATGLKVGMPLAIVGAVIGEWFGSSQGVGPIMLAAMRGYQMPTMWAAVTATVVVALVLYGVCAFVESLVNSRFA